MIKRMRFSDAAGRLNAGSRLNAGVLAAAIGAFGAPPAVAATLCVNPDGTGGCYATIQPAIDAATAGDVIQVAAGAYGGRLAITKSLSITGAGAQTTQISGGGPVVSIVQTGVPVVVALSGVTIQFGATGGGIGTTVVAGVANSGGSLTITDSTIRGNSTGGVSQGGTAIAGIGNFNGSLTISNSTISGNSTGGAIDTGTVIAGIGNFNGSLTITNSTISGNSTGGATNAAGAIGTFSGHTTILNSTLAGNSTGGGIAVSGGLVGPAYVKNTILANFGKNCYVAITSGGYNLEDGTACGLSMAGDQSNTAALLGPLQNNGGSTFTRALLLGSPAIDSGSTDCPPPATDQRGVLRPFPAAGRCDIGAFELETVVPVSIVPTVIPAPNAARWNRTSVTVSWQVTGGTAGAGCQIQTLSVETAGTTLTCSATDPQGRTQSASLTVRIDLTAPVVAYAGNASVYLVDQAVAIVCSASDALSGIAATTCQNITGPAYTFAPGANTFSATASDVAGNPGSGSTSFTVLVTFGGLCSLTRQFSDSPELAHSLCALLTAAEATRQQGENPAAAQLLLQYERQVAARVDSAFTVEEARTLIGLATYLAAQ